MQPFLRAVAARGGVGAARRAGTGNTPRRTLVHRGRAAPAATVGAEASWPAADPEPTNAVDWTSAETYRETVKPVDEATTLPGSVFIDPEFYALERDRLWAHSWVAVAETADLANPGDVIPVEAAGKRLILANDRGTIRGFHNVCRHRGAQLVDKPCSKRRTILCPYHRWGYALDGRLMGTPSFDADEDGKTIPERFREQLRTSHVKNFNKAEMGLLPARVDTALGLVFANVGGEAPPLETWLGDAAKTLGDHRALLEEGRAVPTGHRQVYQIESNWKILIENYLEYYHLPAVHPALCNVSGVDEHRREQGEGMYACFVTDPLTQGGTAIDPGRLPPFGDIAGTPHAERAYHIAIFPNVFFSMYPDHFYRVIVSPNGESNSVERATLFSSQDAIDSAGSDSVFEEMYQFWDNVNSEDIAVCEKVQRGADTGAYPGGRFSFRFEAPVHRFQNFVAQMMVGGAGRYASLPAEDDV